MSWNDRQSNKVTIHYIVCERILILGLLCVCLVPPRPSPIRRVVVAVVVIDQAELAVVVFAAPLDGLGDVAVGCHGAVGRVGVGRLDVAVRAEDLADVLREIPAVGVPGSDPRG